MKEDMKDAMEGFPIVTRQDFEILLTQSLDARNRYNNRAGLSAHQRVFGESLRLPVSLMSDHPIDRMAVATDDTTELQRTAEICDAALKAYIKNKGR